MSGKVDTDVFSFEIVQGYSSSLFVVKSSTREETFDGRRHGSRTVLCLDREGSDQEY